MNRSMIKQQIKEWQVALQYEISHLKKYGSTKYQLVNGSLLTSDQGYTYYFESSSPLRIPVGASIRLEWEFRKQSGRVLSSEGKSTIVTIEQYIGDTISHVLLYHDPWELLEQLIERLDEVKKSKRKRIRINQLLNPTMPAKHPKDNIKSNVHEIVLRSKYNPVTYIWGPPGTGKTYTLARVAGNKYFKGKKVLVLSHSNQAVNVLMTEIAHFIQKMDRYREGEVLRYGAGGDMNTDKRLTPTQLLDLHEPRLSEEKVRLMEQKRLLKKDLFRSFSQRDTGKLLEIERKLSKVLEKIRQKEIQYVKEAQLIGTTLAKAASDPTIYEQEFDLIMIDEASMAYIPQIAFVAALGKRTIVCGDFKQLPPIAASRHSLVIQWLKEDIFHKANVVNMEKNGMLHTHLFLLKEQRRMHPEISAFTNKYVYQSFVGDHKSVIEARKDIILKNPFPKQASILLDTSFTGEYCLQERTSKSRINPLHLFMSFQIIHEAYLNGIKSIGYVTPFRAQAVLMDHLLSDLYENECVVDDIISATVHRFQGSEKDLIVFDVVDGNPISRPSMLIAGTDSERLINVAITRTKGKFIHICDKEYIRKNVYQNKTIRKLVEYQEQKNQIVSLSEVGKWVRHQHPRMQWMYARKLEKVFQDLISARFSIIISLPSTTNLSKDWINVLRKRSKQVKLTVISIKEWLAINPDSMVNESLSFPFVTIDERIFWLGHPLEGMINVKPPYLSVRLESASFTEYFLKQFCV